MHANGTAVAAEMLADTAIAGNCTDADMLALKEGFRLIDWVLVHASANEHEKDDAKDKAGAAVNRVAETVVTKNYGLATACTGIRNAPVTADEDGLTYLPMNTFDDALIAAATAMVDRGVLSICRMVAMHQIGGLVTALASESGSGRL